MSAGPVILTVPAGYRPDWVLLYHGRDPEGLSERVDGCVLTKAVLVAGRPVRLRMEIGADGVALDCDPALDGNDLGTAVGIARRALGLATEVGGLEARAADDPQVARLIGGGAGLRLPLSGSVFEGLCWAVIGQQVNLRFAAVLRRRMIDLAGTPHPSGMVAHPGPEAVARLDVADLTMRQFSRAKAEYLLGAARAAADGRIDFEALPALGPEEAEARLATLRGLGPWSRQYILLRACGFPDCVPAGDAGLAAALQRFHGLDSRPSPEAQRTLMAPYAPWRSLATAHLWASLG